MPLYPEGHKLENMLSWQHSGFNVFIGDRIEFDDGITSKEKKEREVSNDLDWLCRCR